MKKSAFVVSILFISAITLAFANSDGHSKTEYSPHSTALSLIFSTQQNVIRSVDKENWWHDVEDRTWVVKRPFYPGLIDSTHMFSVLYLIHGKEVAKWNVNTETNQVNREEMDEAK